MKIPYILLLLCFALQSKTTSASVGGTFLKSAARSTETQAVRTSLMESSRALIRNTDDFIKYSRIPAARSLSINKNLSRLFKQNLEGFKIKRLSDLADFGLDILGNSISPESDYRVNIRPSTFLQEILRCGMYPQFYKAMCRQLKSDTLTPSVQYLALNGALINGNRISNDSLYHIYLICSDSFAKEELIKLQKSAGCNEQKQREIEDYAQYMGLELPESDCPKKEEEGDWQDMLFRFVILGIITYAVYRTLIWLSDLVKKIGGFFKRK
jgi:hypothetical protein